jgi:hypothetical protein
MCACVKIPGLKRISVTGSAVQHDRREKVPWAGCRSVLPAPNKEP